MITFRSKGDFSKTTKFFERALEAIKLGELDKYGRKGVEALETATPKDSGETAKSWKYEIRRSGSSATIVWYNTHENRGVNIAIILQYGHGTRNGGFVKGRDYINPAIQPIFDEMADAAWKEVTSK